MCQFISTWHTWVTAGCLILPSNAIRNFTLFIHDDAAVIARGHRQVVDLRHREGGCVLGKAAVVEVLENKRPSRA